MRICIIFNPTAKGNKAWHFRRELKTIATQTELRLTTAPGEARLLTAVAVRDGVDAVVAAGGDGTVNEVLNGIGDAPDGFARVWLGILPLGTVNVFAKELGLPMNVLKAWKAIERGRARTVDLAKAEFVSEGKPRTRYFAQLAGAGLDARAIELVDWESKKRIGQFAYLVAGIKAMKERRPLIELTCDAGGAKGELVLIGNGRYYGGRLPVFP
ncbi:MAG: diacylglycerol kinase family lipid kinase, partial [Pedosphaera parvula]|nr:diacylglycerol kinase family lipid kinase [Pedosphaera parvula]